MRTFWDKQPVPQEGQTYESGREIEKEKVITHEPVRLPGGFSWKVCSVEEAHPFLNEYYLASESSRLKYSLETLNGVVWLRSDEHTSELQSHSEISYAFFCF